MEAFMFLMGNPFLTAPPGSQGPIDSVQTESALCSTGEIQFPITSIGGGGTDNAPLIHTSSFQASKLKTPKPWKKAHPYWRC